MYIEKNKDTDLLHGYWQLICAFVFAYMQKASFLRLTNGKGKMAVEILFRPNLHERVCWQ